MSHLAKSFAGRRLTIILAIILPWLLHAKLAVVFGAKGNVAQALSGKRLVLGWRPSAPSNRCGSEGSCAHTCWQGSAVTQSISG